MYYTVPYQLGIEGTAIDKANSARYGMIKICHMISKIYRAQPLYNHLQATVHRAFKTTF